MILLDTDVLIAHLRGHQAAREWLRSTRVEGRLAASAITVTELTDAMRSPERREMARLLSTLSLKPVTLPIARRAGALMRPTDDRTRGSARRLPGGATAELGLSSPP